MARKKRQVTAATNLGRPHSLTDEEVEEVIFRRLAGILDGTAKTIPADEAIRQVREELRRRRGHH